MKILGNPIISKNFKSSKLHLNNTGLYRKVSIENGFSHLIFISDDIVKIMQLLDIDFDKINDELKNDYDILLSSKHFNTKIFFENRSKNPAKDLIDFALYLNENNIEILPFEKISIEKINNLFNIDLNSLVNEVTFVLDNYNKVRSSKINGRLFLKFLPEYNPRNFSTDIPNFTASFEEYEYKKYVVHSNIETIVKDFSNSIIK